MLDNIAQIGEIVAKEQSNNIFDSILENNSSLKHCIAIDFDLKSKKIKFDLLKSDERGLSKEIFSEFLLLPNEKGNRPQFFSTSKKLDYLISQSLPNLADKLTNDDLKSKLNAVIDTFFTVNPRHQSSRYRKVINPQFLPELSVDLEKNTKAKDAIGDYVNLLTKHIENLFQVKGRECFYTLCVNSDPIVKQQAYRDFITEQHLQNAFDDNRHSICAVCGKTEQVTSNTTRFLMKFYVTDKINFSSFFEADNNYKAVTLCASCYQNFILGENWIASHLKSRLGRFSFYLIPQFMMSNKQNERIWDILKNLPDDFNTIKTIRVTSEKQGVLFDSRFSGEPFVINFLFYKKSQASFKILNLIKDIPPYRLLAINCKLNEIGELNGKINIPDSIHFDLDDIYWLVPIRKKGAEHQECKKILQIYNNLFIAIPMQKNQLLSHYVDLAHLHRFESYKLYQIGKQQNPEWAMMSDTIKWNLFFLFLDKLNLLGGNHMESSSTIWIPEKLEPIFTEFGYNPAQQGLALLGYVIQTVAYAQYKEGLKNKPVLGKINYQGMTHEKVIRLFNELFEKIHQYRKHIGFAERYLASGQQLYLCGSGQKLTAHERVFYILSGYSFHLLETNKETVEKGDEA
ncbi:MAG TPA: TIGR02556 family CRISPR-associated protein [bacterium]|nr:TIGR02556 family CRISPR-associated protein [bacterium]HNT67281.1 TIGR02556 family CRISPR-associated protein [bacterium]HOX86228.1 TIGR02556 family CRISPR-associated protein [bacterium]HPG45558.1 TIGR02556 family CRISPR-associated protein [bacterium]HPM97663.1 TIGR02556 family CRISPR-associated protein [bacterium]